MFHYGFSLRWPDARWDHNGYYYCLERGIYVTGYSPLQNPTLIQEHRLLDDPVLNKIASEIHRTPAQVALRYLLQMAPNTVVIPKSIHANRIKENFDLSFDLSLDHMAQLQKLETGLRGLSSAKIVQSDRFGDDF